MKREFIVGLDMPPGVTLEEMAAYIEESVRCLIGTKMPEEPIWHLDRDSVEVAIVRRKRSEG